MTTIELHVVDIVMIVWAIAAIITVFVKDRTNRRHAENAQQRSSWRQALTQFQQILMSDADGLIINCYKFFMERASMDKIHRKWRATTLLFVVNDVLKGMKRAFKTTERVNIADPMRPVTFVQLNYKTLFDVEETLDIIKWKTEARNYEKGADLVYPNK